MGTGGVRRRRTAAVAVCLAALTVGLGLAGVAAPAAPRIVAFAGTGVAGWSGDGGPAVQADLGGPVGMVAQGGTVVVADEATHTVRRIGTDGTITTVAGTGVAGWSGDGGRATAAQLAAPRDVAARPNGELFVADTGNHVVRAIDGGTIRTVAGTGTAGFAGDEGPGTSAQLSSPSGVAVRPNGHLVIADTGNHRVREVALDGTITTIAGGDRPGDEGDGGPAAEALLDSPTGVAVFPNGTILVADTGNHRIRQIDQQGIITSVVGTGHPGRSGDGGQARAAELHAPEDVVAADDGSVLIADTGNHLLRRKAPDGTLVTLAGSGQSGDAGDGGPATLADLRAPRGVVDVGGRTVVADTGNHRLRQLAPPLAPPTLTAVVPGPPANDNAPRVIGAAQSGSTISLHGDAVCAGPVLAEGTAGDLAAGLVVPVPDDSVTAVYARAATAAGAVSACSTTSVTYEEDSTAPLAPTVELLPVDDGFEERPLWRLEAGAGEAMSCRLGGGVQGWSGWAPCSGLWSVRVDPTRATTWTLEARATDQAGNTGPVAASSYLVVPPVVEPLDPTPTPTPEPTPEPVRPDPSPAVPAPTPPAGPPPATPDAAPAAPVAVLEDQTGTAAASQERSDTSPSSEQPRSIATRRAAPAPVRPPRPAAVVDDSPVALVTPAAEPMAPAGRVGLGEAILEVVARSGEVIARNADTAAFPLLLVLLLVGYLALQDQIDRRDPKLAMAPVAEPELDFPTPPRPVPKARPSCWVARHAPPGRHS